MKVSGGGNQGCLHLVLCLAAAFIAVGTGVQAGPKKTSTKDQVNPDGSRSPDLYLKQSDRGWTSVVRNPRTGAVLSRKAAEAPRPTRAPGARVGTVQAVGASATSPFAPYAIYPTGSFPEAVAIGDVNNDGRNDIVMVTSFYFDPANDYSLHVWIQDTDGTLKPRVVYYLGGDPQSVAVGDVNGDGLKDVVVALGNGIGVLAQNAQGTLDSMVLHPTTDSLRVRVADLNHDGRQDVVALGWGTNTVSVLLQQSDGTLGSPVVYSAPHGGYDDLEVGDVNGDGLMDVIAMSGQSFAPNFTVLYQQQDGTLGGAISRSVGVNRLAGGIGVGDVNGDGKSDVVIGMSWAGAGTPELDVFPQQPDGSLPAAPSQSLPMGYPEPVEVGDVTADGRNDVIAFDGYASDLALFRQSGNGQLGAEEMLDFPYATHLNRHGIAIGDINGDGRNDVVVANYNNGLVVYPNAGAQVTVSAPVGMVPLHMPTTIQWLASGAAFDSFDVSYSIDGGASYAAVPGCTGLPASAVSCAWPSPGPVTTQGRVKVVGRALGGAALAAGVSSITIVQPVLIVTAPNTAVIWPASLTQAITWTSNFGSSEAVAIELSRDGGTTWTTLAASTPNGGSLSWSVTNPTTNAARVRITSITDPSVWDTSDVDFTIDRPPVANAGPDSTVELGLPTALSGAASFDPDGNALTYAWYRGNTIVGTAVTTAVTLPLGATTFTLVVADPYGLTSTDSVTINVEDTTPPAVIVVSPIAGSALDVGVPVPVGWTAMDQGTISSFDVSASNDSGGTYSPVPGCVHLPSTARSCVWTPSATTTGTAVVRVVGRDAQGNGGAGGASYAVSVGSHVKVTEPNDRGVWQTGSTRTISWLHNVGAGESMTIELSRDGGRRWEVICASARNSSETIGWWNWQVTGPRTAKARIRVTWTGHPESDTSDFDFRIMGGDPTGSPRLR